MRPDHHDRKLIACFALTFFLLGGTDQITIPAKTSEGITQIGRVGVEISLLPATGDPCVAEKGMPYGTFGCGPLPIAAESIGK